MPVGELPRPRGTPRQGRVRVVLADDVAELRDLVRFILELDGGFEVVGEAGDGAAAAAVAAAEQPDLVLLDLSMPRMDGLEALPRIRSAAPAAKVVVFSGFRAERMAHVAEAMGAVTYLEKGLPPSDLLARLRAVCNGRYHPPGCEQDEVAP